MELADHHRFTEGTEVDVYFCDPRSPGKEVQMKIRIDYCDSTSQRRLVYEASISIT
jgi:IS30 family transposase